MPSSTLFQSHSNDMKQNLVMVGIAVVVVLVGNFVFKTAPQVINQLGAVSSPDIQGYLNVHGAFTQGGRVTTATPVAATYTLTFADMIDSNVITFTASSTMPALTVTLPASTQIPLSPEAGSYRSWVIENPFTAAATTTTIAAGSGVDLQEPDGQNVVIEINNYAFITCYREMSANVVCRVDETIPAD